MRMAADVAGDDEAPRAVTVLAASRRGDPAVHDVEVRVGDPHRVERGDDGGAGEEHQCSTPWPWWTRCGTAASAAGDSFIGRRVRRIPSNA